MSAQGHETARAGGVRPWLFAPLLGFACLTAIFVVALRAGDPSKLPSALIGKPAPAMTSSLPLLDGVPRSALSGDAGRRPAVIGQGYPVLVNFFASWCPPCRAEHPLLMQLARSGDLPILGIDHKDQASAGRRFLEQLGNPYDRVAVDADGRAGIEWGVYGMPETFLVDGRGIVVWKQVGPLSAEIIDGALRQALAKAR